MQSLEQREAEWPHRCGLQAGPASAYRADAISWTLNSIMIKVPMAACDPNKFLCEPLAYGDPLGDGLDTTSCERLRRL
jgi:hypothetical protein